MVSKKTPKADFEKSLDQLTQIVERMERGNLPLEESLACFEQGVTLIRDCQKALNQAEQKIQILTQQQGMETLTTFNPEDADDD